MEEEVLVAEVRVYEIAVRYLRTAGKLIRAWPLDEAGWSAHHLSCGAAGAGITLLCPACDSSAVLCRVFEGGSDLE